MRILRDTQVGEKLAYSRATVWRRAKTDPDFPQPVKLSAGRTGWIEAEVDEYLAKKVAESRDKAEARRKLTKRPGSEPFDSTTLLHEFRTRFATEGAGNE